MIFAFRGKHVHQIGTFVTFQPLVTSPKVMDRRTDRRTECNALYGFLVVRPNINHLLVLVLVVDGPYRSVSLEQTHVFVMIVQPLLE